MDYLDGYENGSACAKYNTFVQSNSTKPMPWIGLYIAAASLVCLIFILADVYNASRKGQVWFPCRYFSLNAASLTILVVASKLSVDLTSAMPGTMDQAAKLSTSVLVCVSMAIFIPTLGAMKDTELVANFIAVVILIITIIANLCLQLVTGGVIDAFLPGHIFVMGSMVYLLMVCCSTVVALASIKNELSVKYEKNNRSALDEFMNGSSETKTKRLEDYLRKFSMMSHTGWPYMVLGRSRLGSTTAFICTIDTLCLLIIAFFTGPFSYDLGLFCDGKSDYKWSTFLICYIQVSATLAGLVAVSPKLLFKPTTQYIPTLSIRIKNAIKLEGYWTLWLVEIKQRPLFLFIHNKQRRKFVHHAKNHFCNFLIAMQIAMVLMIKLFGSLYELVVAFPLRSLYRFFWNLYNSYRKYSSPPKENLIELKPYILYLEGEEELIESMMEIALKATKRYIKMARKEEPDHLIEFLETSLSRGFKGVFEFDSDQVCCLNSQEPPTHCWSLPVVTMISIAISLPNIERCLLRKLLKSVREGLVFVKLVEDNLNHSTDLINMRKAADIVWEQVDIHGSRLDVKLNKLAVQGNHLINIFNFLVDSAKENFQAFKLRKEKTSVWPIEAVASNSLYRICQTILLDCQKENSQLQTASDVFEMLSSAICDILGACLTNLEHIILMECSRSTIENMNETAQRVLNLFGRTQKVMELLNGRERPNLSSDQLVFIDEWRLSSNNMTNHLP